MVAAYVIGRWYGVTIDQISAGLNSYKARGFRQVIRNIGNRYLYLDCFSMTELSVLTSINTMIDIENKGGRKIAVIGGAMHFGDMSQETFEQIGRSIKNKPIDKLICFGEVTRPLYNIVKECGNIPSVFTENKAVIEKELMMLAENDLILFKSVFGEALTSSVDKVFGLDTYINLPYYRRTEGIKFVYNNFVAMIFGQNRHMAVIEYYRGSGEGQSIKLPDYIDGRPVTHINMSAFKGKKIREITIGKYVSGIEKRAFSHCYNLENIHFNSKLRILSEGCFEYCTSLKEVNLPDGLFSIEKEAFKKCTQLHKVVIPNSVKYIDDNAFEGCRNLEIICNNGSYAYEYKMLKSKNEEKEATIIFTGNILHKLGGEFSVENIKEIKPVLMQGDWCVGSLDIASCFEMKVNDFKTRIDVLKQAGFNCLINQGEYVYEDSRYLLTSYVNAEKRSDMDILSELSSSQCIKELNGIKIGIIAYEAFHIIDEAMNCKKCNESIMRKEIENLRNQGAEFIIVNLNWGFSKNTSIEDRQRRISKSLVKAGADLITGIYSHCLQETEWIFEGEKQVLCCYSLGNLYSTMENANNRISAILKIELSKEKGKIKVDYSIIPTRVFTKFLGKEWHLLPTLPQYTIEKQSNYFDSTNKVVHNKLIDIKFEIN